MCELNKTERIHLEHDKIDSLEPKFSRVQINLLFHNHNIKKHNKNFCPYERMTLSKLQIRGPILVEKRFGSC